jgi:transposase
MTALKKLFPGLKARESLLQERSVKTWNRSKMLKSKVRIWLRVVSILIEL